VDYWRYYRGNGLIEGLSFINEAASSQWEIAGHRTVPQATFDNSMKRFLILPLLLSGCAYLHSTTTKTTDPKTNITVVKTSVRAYTLWDGQSALAKFTNRGETVTSNEWSAGTYIGSLSQSSSSTNINELAGAVVGAAVSAAIKAK
jgi:hypothetical protein